MIHIIRINLFSQHYGLKNKQWIASALDNDTNSTQSSKNLQRKKICKAANC